MFFAPICQNFRKFARVLPPFALFCHTRRDLSTDLFAPIVQKVLDIVDALLYNRRRAFKINAQLPQKVLDNPGSCAYTTRVGTGSSTKTMPFEKNFALTRKKDLTIVAFARILAQGPPMQSSSHYYWRPRAKNRAKSSPAISKRDRGQLTRLQGQWSQSRSDIPERQSSQIS